MCLLEGIEFILVLLGEHLDILAVGGRCHLLASGGGYIFVRPLHETCIGAGNEFTLSIACICTHGCADSDLVPDVSAFVGAY